MHRRGERRSEKAQRSTRMITSVGRACLRQFDSWPHAAIDNRAYSAERAGGAASASRHSAAARARGAMPHACDTRRSRRGASAVNARPPLLARARLLVGEHRFDGLDDRRIVGRELRREARDDLTALVQ